MEPHDNEALEHVVHLGSLDDTTRVPSEQQHEEKSSEQHHEENRGHDEIIEHQHEESEESSVIDLFPVPEFDISDYVDESWLLVPGYQPKSWAPGKSEWIDLWFNPHDSRIDIYEAIREHISDEMKSIDKVYTIQVAGYCGKDKNPGYGAIVCDCLLKPLVAESQVLSEEERVSQFYHELQGVDLGLKLAVEHGVLNFWFYCTSSPVARFLRQCLVDNTRCTCTENSGSESHCREVKECDICLKSRMPFDQKIYEAYILPVIKSIIDSVSILESQGLPYACFMLTQRDENKVAECLAKLGESKRMYPRDIQENNEITDLLYADADQLHRTFYVGP